MRRVQKLSFIGCGVQKGGTTALFRYLEQHPELATPAKKELNFFDTEFMDWSRPDYRPYHAYFPRSGAGLRYDITPTYIYWPETMERIRAYNPDIKLIALFRDPVERAYSQWAMQYARGAETLTFQDAIRDGRARVNSGSKDDFRFFSYVERGFYGAQVTRLLSLFPREQQLFLRAEDLAREPVNVLNAVADFTGIARYSKVPQVRANTKRKIDYPSGIEPEDRALLGALYRDDLADFARLTGLDVSQWPSVTGEFAAPGAFAV